MELRFYIDDKLVEHPKNARELTINLDFTKENDPELSVTSFDFVNENAQTINDYLQGGITGGSAGIFEGLPFRVEVTEGSNVETLIDGYIDLTQTETQFSCYTINTSVGETASTDWLDGSADSFRFAYLYDQGIITDSDFVDVPYIVSAIPKYNDFLLAVISLFVLIKELKKVIQDIVEIVADIAGAMNSIGGVIKAIAYAIYAVALLLAIIEMFKIVIDTLIQPIKNHKAMFITTQGSKKGLIDAACEHLGITYQSSLLSGYPWNRMVIIPEKNKTGKTNKPGVVRSLFGVSVDPVVSNDKIEKYGYFEGTFKDLLIGLKEMFNAKIIMEDNTLFFEHKLFFKKSSSYLLPDLYNDFYGTNASELTSNYVLKFQTDTIDLNTIDDYQGTLVQSTLTPVDIKNKKNVLLKNLKTIEIPFALAKRKNELTIVEKVVDGFLEISDAVIGTVVWVYNNTLYKAADAAIKVIGVIIDILNFFGSKMQKPKLPEKLPRPSLGEIINNRIGMMKLHNDFIGVPKILLIDTENKVHNDNFSYLRALYLYKTYHYCDNFNSTGVATLSGSGDVIDYRTNDNGQRYLYKHDKIPFCFNDYLLVKSNNIIKLADGRTGELIKLEWTPYSDFASIEYKVEQIYTNNLKEKIIEND